MASARRTWPASDASRTQPWTIEDFLRLTLLTVVGLIMLVIAWYTAATEPRASQQIGPLNLAVGGAAIAGLGDVFWLLRGRRAIGERRRRILGEPPEAARSQDAQTRSRTAVLVAGEHQRHFHRADCTFAAGRGWKGASVQEHLAAGRKPCGVCRP